MDHDSTLEALILEFLEKPTYRDPIQASEKTEQLLERLRRYPPDGERFAQIEPRLVRGLALYYLREIYDLAFLADAVDRPETDADDKVNEVLLSGEGPKWLPKRLKPVYQIKAPFCNDRYTHKFVDEWYAERRYAINIYGSIVVQLPSPQEPRKSPGPVHRFIGWWFARGVATDALILIILLFGCWLLYSNFRWAGAIYLFWMPLLAVIIWGYLLGTRGAHVLKAIVPRLAACAVVGLVLPLATDEVWKFSFRLWDKPGWFWFVVSILLAASWLYLFVETHNHVGRCRLSAWRAFHILIRLCTFALFFSWWATSIVSTVAPSLVKGQPDLVVLASAFPLSVTVTVPLPALFLFAVVAVFIGTFLQILWEERAITSRL